MKQTTLSRIMAKISKDNDCWLWQGGKNSLGYGLMNVGGKMRNVSRVMYEVYNNTTLPMYLNVTHTCNHRNCINPQHLKLLTKQELYRKVGIRHSKFRGVSKPKFSCEHCGGLYSANMLGRWHGDNCKAKKFKFLIAA